MAKFVCYLSLVLVLILSAFSPSNAELIDRGGGLIYDTVLDITWLQDANYAQTSGYDDDGKMTWLEALAWAEQLEIYDSTREVILKDWRLPKILPINGTSYNYTSSYDGSTDEGFNLSAYESAYPGSLASEMAYMFFNNLGNIAQYDTNGNPQPNYGLNNVLPFINLKPSGAYWAMTDYDSTDNQAWIFFPEYGFQHHDHKETDWYAWAVRDGDVIPHPYITPIAPMAADGDHLYSYQPAIAENGIPINELTWSLSNEPDGMTIDSSTGAISWDPTSFIGTTEEITLTVTYEVGATDTEVFTISVFHGHPAKYKLTANGIPGGLITINNPGQILFYAGVWDNGEIVGFSGNSGGIYEGTGMNDQGVVSANCDNNNYGRGLISCIWDNGEIRYLEPGSMYSTSINNKMQVTIWAVNWAEYSGIWEDGVRTDIIRCPISGNGECLNRPNAINNLGQVVGYYDPDLNIYTASDAYLWDSGTLYNLNDLVTEELNFKLTDARDINDQGQIIGTTDTGHSFLYEKGSVVDLGDIDAVAINVKGQIVGDKYLYNQGTFVDLNTLIDPRPDWSIVSVIDINNHGQIIGYGKFNSGEYSILLNPVPEAAFNGDPVEGKAPLTVEFKDISLGVTDTWEWDFGDGSTSDEQNPSHTYDSPGLYTVTLTMSGPHGSDTKVETDYIIVGCDNHIYFKDTDGDTYSDPSNYIYACTPPSNYIAPAGVSELVTNGTMENDSNWADWETPTANERSSEQVFNGNFSRKFIADSAYDGIKSNGFKLIAGETYRINLRAYGDGSAPLRCLVYMYGLNSTYKPNGAYPIPPPAWTKYSWSYTPTTSGTYSFYAELAPGGTSGTFYIDDVSITQALESNSDCNDNDKLINPGVDEICNGLDDNCNDQIDEGVKTTYYKDVDKDGFGTPNTTTQACSAPTGYVTDNTDLCDDNKNKIIPGICGCVILDIDSDKDSTPDCIDGCPSDPNKIDIGICGCGVADTDTDKDGTVDCRDNCPADKDKINPGTCGCGTSDVDTDKDGKPDCLDNCNSSLDSDGDGQGDCDENCPFDKNKIEPGKCGCGVPDTDADVDGTPDCLDSCPNDLNKTAPGACGCGVFDTDADLDGTADCNDNCPNDPNKTSPGFCGCGIEDTDADDDDVPECIDTQPVAKIILPESDKEINVGDKIKFQCSVTGGNTPYQYTWDFDGGAADFVDKDPGEVEFTKVGVFKVTLFVDDNNGDTGSDSVTITVIETPSDDDDGGGGGGGGGCFIGSAQ